jgi:hypothetical protein
VISEITSTENGSNYTIDLSEIDDSVFINGFKVTSTPVADKLVVVGYDQNIITGINGVFSLTGNDSLVKSITGFEFDGDVSVKTLKTLLSGTISKDIKVYSGDTLVQQIKLIIKVSSDGDALDIDSTWLQNYTMTVTDKTHTATLKPGKEGEPLLTGSGLYAKIKAMVTVVPAGYQYKGVSIGIDDNDYTDVTNNDAEILTNLLAKLDAADISKGINQVTLGDLRTAKITVKVYVMKDGQSECNTVVFK